MQIARPPGSRSSPKAAQRCAAKAQGLTANRVDEAQLAVPNGAEIPTSPVCPNDPKLALTRPIYSLK
jgi:hypothetical protein